MSIPISICLIRRAITDDETLQTLQERLQYNKKFGAMTIYGCNRHQPPCELLSEEEFEVLNKRLETLDKKRKKEKS